MSNPTTAHNRVEILHGVNLDTLGRRDPSIYGSFTLAELETQVKRWATELGNGHDLLPDQPRGRVLRVPAPAARTSPTR